MFLRKFIKQINYFIFINGGFLLRSPSILRQQLRFLHAATGFIIPIESNTAQKTTHGMDVHSAIMTLDICVTLTHWRVHVRPHLLSLLGVHQCARRINTYVYWHTLRDVPSFPKDCENHFCIPILLSFALNGRAYPSMQMPGFETLGP